MATQSNFSQVLNNNLEIRKKLISNLSQEIDNASSDDIKLLLAVLSDTDNVALKQMKIDSDNNNAGADRDLVIATLKHISENNNKNPFEGISETSNIPKLQNEIKEQFEINENEMKSFDGTTYGAFKQEMINKNPDLKKQIES